jgi:hypothetical protein
MKNGSRIRGYPGLGNRKAFSNLTCYRSISRTDSLKISKYFASHFERRLQDNQVVRFTSLNCCGRNTLSTLRFVVLLPCCFG